jgi:hypothetical protein
MYSISPGDWTGIIISPVPWIIIVPRSINHHTTVNIGISISGQVTHINYFRSGFVYICVFYIINGTFRWNFIHFSGLFHTNFPGTCWFVRLKPDGIVHTVIDVVNQQN